MASHLSKTFVRLSILLKSASKKAFCFHITLFSIDKWILFFKIKKIVRFTPLSHPYHMIYTEAVFIYLFFSTFKQTK